ncbi:helix-turn-helix domain-containing protein [Ralstonia sp. CHL-2022]|uniref:Helix-turn-helix domain-containing protein n=1 Tax=Ralstonia mojiangensis TaxID=2953895 RepID=A0ABT2L635_9RALS|nr:helix-turn-helix transcriptional regulator [Ralstonia mojiangensis]MCT7297596.1 helix-turn-helix domain-containing protein [Ralstonia mojiangensis]MCT7310188.1 helix-turn-helix domain-containing protein [Ralstonia mojiangensis]
MTRTDLTPDEMLLELGEMLRSYRLFKNLEQEMLAEMAGISPKALQHLESGSGTRLKTFLCVLCAFGLQDRIKSVVPVGATGSQTPAGAVQARQRASRSRLRRST